MDQFALKANVWNHIEVETIGACRISRVHHFANEKPPAALNLPVV